MNLDETPDECPLDCIEETDSVYVTGEARKSALAIMFDITARTDTAITSLGIMAQKGGEDEVLVVSGGGRFESAPERRMAATEALDAVPSHAGGSCDANHVPGASPLTSLSSSCAI